MLSLVSLSYTINIFFEMYVLNMKYALFHNNTTVILHVFHLNLIHLSSTQTHAIAYIEAEWISWLNGEFGIIWS